MCEFNINKQQLKDTFDKLGHERSRINLCMNSYLGLARRAQANVSKIDEIVNIIRGILHNESFSIFLRGDEFDHGSVIDVPAAPGVNIFKDERLGEEPGVAV